MNKKTVVGMPLLMTLSFGTENVPVDGRGDVWIWVALFALAIIGVLILFISSYQTKKIEKIHQEIFNRQKEMEKNQALILSNMGENIHDMVTKALKIEGDHDAIGGHFISKLPEGKENLEEKLLTVTNDLIEFLRLKSDKITIENETFNLNNVLNEISGYICSRYRGKDIDLIFDIHHNVPRLMIGDSLHLGQVINGILEYMMSTLKQGELQLEIEMFNTYKEEMELQFRFVDTGDGLSAEAIEKLFIPHYDEKNGTYRGLGLFVSGELVKMMGGELTVQSQLGKGTSFVLTLPIDIFDKNNKRKYRLPEKVLTSKKVFIVDRNYNSALAIKKSFAYFRHEVKVVSLEVFLESRPNLTPYDIVVLHETLFDRGLTGYLQKIKLEKELKIISLSALLQMRENPVHNDVIDMELYTPMNQERIFEMIVNMYNIDVEAIETEEQENANDSEQHKPKVYRSHIQETSNVTRSSFSTFKGKHILIVEDNAINQKVLASLLVPSGVEISLANNGQEAVDMVKAQEDTFDLVLMDINMPILDGYAATEMIRQDKTFDMLPIVAFTALVLDSEIEKMFGCGINAFLSKPLNIGKLYTALSMFLSETQHNTRRKEQRKEKVKQVTSLKGLDIQHGIAHANNSKVLYLEVLHEFMEAYGQSDQLFEKLVREHRHEQIKMLCIDMRGLTGTIGAHEMLSVINKIHQSILYKKEDLLPNFIQNYREEIGVLNRAIEEYLSLSGYKAAG